MANSKTVLVTGAAGGVGSALCARLTSSGYRVAAVSREKARLDGVDAEVKIAADCTTADGVADIFAQAEEALGEAPAGLAHCVGNTLITPLHRTRAEAWSDVVRVNLDSAFHTLHGWINARQRLGGSAVVVSSVVAQIGVANHEAIAAAKGGLEALVRSAAASYSQQNLRFNAVAPGLTETPLTAPMLKSDSFRDAATKQYPLGGIQSAEDIAGVMEWLLGPTSSRVTGQIIPVDGGFTSVRPLVK
jgi:NAD(P)-dependent dehydrogenase (short-subunit alcohol dehydrogenase family)